MEEKRLVTNDFYGQGGKQNSNIAACLQRRAFHSTTFFRRPLRGWSYGFVFLVCLLSFILQMSHFLFPQF